MFLVLEKEVCKRFSQEPVMAPSVKTTSEKLEAKLNGDMSNKELRCSSSQQQLTSSGEEKKRVSGEEKSHYLFEKIDPRLLRADEEHIKRIHS